MSAEPCARCGEPTWEGGALCATCAEEQERRIVARCGSSDPHGAHWIYPTRWCAGNRNIVEARDA